MSPPKKNQFNFEQALAALEQLVDKMERGEYGLDESLRQFEQGVTLIRACQGALAEAEQKVQLLVQNGANQELVSFTPPQTQDLSQVPGEQSSQHSD
jgi:exodeoxyribonuclease VII small subunit